MYAVGSIIAIQDNKFMVCGYRPIEQDGAVGMGYLLLPYPLGFTNIESFSLVSADTDYPTVFEGFRNESAEQYDAALERVRVEGRNTSWADFTAAIPDLLDELEVEQAATDKKEA